MGHLWHVTFTRWGNNWQSKVGYNFSGAWNVWSSLEMNCTGCLGRSGGWQNSLQLFFAKSWLYFRTSLAHWFAEVAQLRWKHSCSWLDLLSSALVLLHILTRFPMHKARRHKVPEGEFLENLYTPKCCVISEIHITCPGRPLLLRRCYSVLQT